MTTINGLNLERVTLLQQISDLLQGAKVENHETHADCLRAEDFADYFPGVKTQSDVLKAVERMQEDLAILCLRLMFSNETDSSPETLEVLSRRMEWAKEFADNAYQSPREMGWVGQDGRP